MSANKKLREHKNHDIVVSLFGDKEDPDDISIVCEDCNEVLYYRNNPRVEDPDPADDETETGADFETLLKHAECYGVKVRTRKDRAALLCIDCDTVLYSEKE